MTRSFVVTCLVFGLGMLTGCKSLCNRCTGEQCATNSAAFKPSSNSSTAMAKKDVAAPIRTAPQQAAPSNNVASKSLASESKEVAKPSLTSDRLMPETKPPLAAKPLTKDPIVPKSSTGSSVAASTPSPMVSATKEPTASQSGVDIPPPPTLSFGKENAAPSMRTNAAISADLNNSASKKSAEPSLADPPPAMHLTAKPSSSVAASPIQPATMPTPRAMDATPSADVLPKLDPNVMKTSGVSPANQHVVPATSPATTEKFTPAPVPSQPSNTAKPGNATAVVMPTDGPVTPEDYSEVTGTLIRLQSRRVWQIRYAGHDKSDKYGGAFMLTGALPDNLKEGQRVRVRGRVENNDAALHATMYRVFDLTPL